MPGSLFAFITKYAGKAGIYITLKKWYRDTIRKSR